MARIIEGELSDPRVIDLLHTHLTTARAQTPPGSAHALDLAGLRSPDIRSASGRCGTMRRFLAAGR